MSFLALFPVLACSDPRPTNILQGKFPYQQGKHALYVTYESASPEGPDRGVFAFVVYLDREAKLGTAPREYPGFVHLLAEFPNDYLLRVRVSYDRKQIAINDHSYNAVNGRVFACGLGKSGIEVHQIGIEPGSYQGDGVWGVIEQLYQEYPQIDDAIQKIER